MSHWINNSLEPGPAGVLVIRGDGDIPGSENNISKETNRNIMTLEGTRPANITVYTLALLRHKLFKKCLKDGDKY